MTALGEYEPAGAVSVVATNSQVYWTDLLQEQIRFAARDGSREGILVERSVPQCLTVSGTKLFWKAAPDARLNDVEIGYSTTTGESPTRLVEGPNHVIGTSSAPCEVCVRGNTVYWHTVNQNGNARVSRLNALDLGTGVTEVLVERVHGLTDLIWDFWLIEDTLLWRENDGIHRLDLATRQQSVDAVGAFTMRKPVAIGDALYFLGHPDSDSSLDGVWRLAGGQLKDLSMRHVILEHSALGTDGERLYLLDNESHELLDIDVNTGEAKMLWGEAPLIASNLVVDSGAFIFASRGQILEVRFSNTSD